MSNQKKFGVWMDSHHATVVSGGTEEKPVGLVFVGYADANEVKSREVKLPGDRYLIRWRASQFALDYLRRKLLRKAKNSDE